MYIAFPLLAIFVLFDNLENGISQLLYSLPFCFLNVFISPILYLACWVFFIGKFYFISIFKEKTKPRLLPLIFVAIFLIYCLMPMGEYNLNTLIRFMLFACLFLALCMITSKPNVFRGHFNVRLLCLAILVASVFSFSWYFSPYLKGYLEIYYAANETIPRFMALFYNTNVLGMFCEVLLSLLVYFILSKQANKWDFILFVALALVGVLTFSKTYFAVLTLLLLILWVWLLCKKFNPTIIVSGVVIVAAVAVCLAFPQIFHKFLNIFNRSFKDCNNADAVMNKITTGRFDLWVQYSSYMAAHPITIFFGRGLGAPMLPTLVKPLSVHNAYLAMVYEIGLVGAALLITAIFFILRSYYKAHPVKVHPAISVPIIVLALIFMVEDLIFFIFV